MTKFYNDYLLPPYFIIHDLIHIFKYTLNTYIYIPVNIYIYKMYVLFHEMHIMLFTILKNLNKSK